MMIGQCIVDALATSGPASPWTVNDVELIQRETRAATAAAFDDGDAAAAEGLHGAAYRLYVARHEPPWTSGLPDVASPIFATFLWEFGRAWDRATSARHADTLRTAPRDADEYATWVVEFVRQHESNVGHPLFDFLAEEADREQLREFVHQETPFDVYFADILASLLPGVYGEPKIEIAHNLWDEMGGGRLANTHRTLRLDLMRHLDIPEDGHRVAVDDYLIEEIELANAYFLGTADRTRALQLIGMLLATESMVPGRLQRQIDGWRRVGLADEQMRYLLEHTVVDVEHAEDWMEHVVCPIVRERPETVTQITLGVVRRLEVAGRVCDRMIAHLSGIGRTAAAV